MKLFSLLIFPFIIQLSHAFSQTTTVITDLESTVSTNFITEAGSWTISSPVCSSCDQTYTSISTTCTGFPQTIMYGGYNILGPSGQAPTNQYFQRVYSSVTKSGSFVGTTIDIWTITSGDVVLSSLGLNNVVSITLNADTYERWAYDWKTCSNIAYSDGQGGVINQMRLVTVRQFWNVGDTDTLTLKILNKLTVPTTTTSFGIRNIKIYTGGVNGQTASILGNWSTFPCLAKWSWNGTDCDPTCTAPCATCFGILATECLTCQTSFYNYGNGTCLNKCDPPFEPDGWTCNKACPGEFFWKGMNTCSEECPEPLTSSIDDNKWDVCENPCLYDNGALLNEYMYPDQTCGATCDAPLKSEDLSICATPCANADHFTFPNGTCVSTCNSPLTSSSLQGINYCKSSCPTQFLYPNKTCKSDCPSPLIKKESSDVKLCLIPCDEYLYNDGSCKSSCPLPLLTRSEPGVDYCENPCSGDQYLYPNSTCKEDCPSPLVPRTEVEAKYCENPCGVNTEYLYDNGDCSGQCNFPLLVYIDPGFTKYCYNPCYSNGTFLYPNGSCISTCLEPLVQKTEHDVKYCVNPCSNLNNYLYPNKTCSSQCPYPLYNRIEPVAKYCFSPCGEFSPLFFYKNGSCLSACNTPYLKSKSYNVNQCTSPCEDPKKEYFYEVDNICKGTCEYPYEIKQGDNVKICFQVFQATVAEVQAAQSLVSSVKAQGEVTQSGMKSVSAVSSGKPGIAWLAGQASMLLYIRYIDLDYTPKLKLAFFLQDANPFDFSLGIEMPGGLEEKLTDRELPEIFERYEMDSNFLKNSWDTLTTVLLILAIIFGLSMVKLLTAAKFTRIDRILGVILGSLKWNTPLMVLSGSFGKIYFDASLQLHAASFGSIWEVISVGLAVIMMFIGTAILFLAIKIVKEIWRSRNSESSNEEMEKKWANFQLFFESYRRNSFVSFGYMAIFLSRSVIFNLIVANLYNYPLVQSILINLVTFIMVGYLIIQRPMKSLLEFVQLLINEIFVIIVNTCALIVAIMDKAHIQGQDLRNDLCNTIMTILSVFSSFNLGFFLLQVLVTLIFFIRILKRLKAQNKLNPRGILNIILLEKEKESPNIGKKDNENKFPISIQPQRRKEISDNNKSELFHVAEDISVTKMDETENHQKTSGISIPRRFFKPRTIAGRPRNIGNDLSFLDRSTVEMLPSEGPIQTSNDSSPDLSRQLTLESNNRSRDSIVFPVDPVVATSAQEKPDFGLPDTILQFRKMRNYLRRNRERDQQE